MLWSFVVCSYGIVVNIVRWNHCPSTSLLWFCRFW